MTDEDLNKHHAAREAAQNAFIRNAEALNPFAMANVKMIFSEVLVQAARDAGAEVPGKVLDTLVPGICDELGPNLSLLEADYREYWEDMLDDHEALVQERKNSEAA